MSPGDDSTDQIPISLRSSFVVTSALCLSFALIATGNPLPIAFGVFSLGGITGATAGYVRFGTRANALVGFVFGVVGAVGLYGLFCLGVVLLMVLAIGRG
jgi:hypothetical protein